MNFILVGVNHKTAPVALRERLAFPEASLPEALHRLTAVEGLREGLILSTCNRVELLASGEPEAQMDGRLPNFLASYHGLSLAELAPHLYEYRHREAIRHVFRVAASLDSMIVGEPQILGQVKSAYAAARAAGAIGGLLEELMHCAFAVAKKVRSETGIAQSAVSVSYAAVELARKIFGSLGGKTVLLIGAGKMSELAARHLLSSGVTAILVANRSYDRAEELASLFGSGEVQARAVRMEDLPDCLARADIVISSTGSAHFIVTKEDGPRVLARRRNRPMFFIDIAVPRDIDPQLNTVDNIFLYDIDDLEEVVHANLRERRQEALLGEQIVEHAVERFLEHRKMVDAVPTIVSLQARLEEIRQGELERLRGRLGPLAPEQEAALEQLTRGIVNKILHVPITQLKASTREPEGWKVLDAVRRIFKLD